MNLLDLEQSNAVMNLDPRKFRESKSIYLTMKFKGFVSYLGMHSQLPSNA